MSQRPKVTRVVMYKHGVAHIERSGPVDGHFDITFRRDDMNDVLKSLAVGVASGDATVGAVAFETPIDPEAALEARNLLLNPGEALTGLVNAARGRKVVITTGADTHRGLVIGTDEVDGGTGPPRRHVTLFAEDGTIRLVDLAAARSLEFVEEPSRQDLDYLVDQLRASTAGENCIVRVTINGAADDLRVSYVVPAPVWRVSYRLVSDGDAVTLMAMAIVHNPVDEDLENVELTLTTGQPVSFDIDLYHGKWVQRAVIDEQDRAGTAPTGYEVAGDYALGGAPSSIDGVNPSPGAMPMATRSMAKGAFAHAADSYDDDLAEAGERGEQFEYRLAAPLSLKRGGAAMAPLLVATLAGARKERFWRAGSAPAPDIVLAFDNTSGVVLEEGPAVVYDDGSYAGEAMVPFTTRGGDVRLAFAKDLAVRCSQTTTSDVVTTRLRLGDDALIEERRQDDSHELVAENDGDEPVTVIFELPRRAGYTVGPDTAEPFEQTASYRRYRVEAPAHDAATLMVAESRPQHRRTQYGHLAPDQLQRWMGERLLDKATFRALAKVLAHWRDAETLDQEGSQMASDRADLFAAQSRITEQLNVLRDTGPEGAVRQRSVVQLEALQDQVTALEHEIRRTREAADDARRAATAELQRVIGNSPS